MASAETMLVDFGWSSVDVVFSDVSLLNRRRLSTNRVREKDGFKKVDDIEWSLRNPRLFGKKRTFF